MRNYTYVIVGGGMTADAAAEGIRAADPAGTLGLISAEPHPPYYRRLRGLAAQRLRFAVIGGGFIGSEVAAALRMQDREVTMLVPEAGLGARVFPPALSRFLGDYYRTKGVEMRTGEGMAGLGRQ